ncbi:MAG TPA: hypothetical protein VE090_00780 [Methylomirabilota bacterium]|nr:hypothetical protein [Methylomirabilota bacterium]
MQADGDGLGIAHKHVIFDLLPQAVRILAPDQSNRTQKAFRESGEQIVWEQTKKIL